METNTLDWMPAKPLTPDQQADAKRLQAAFLQWQEDEEAVGRPHSQAEVAFKLGFGQSAMSQYLRGLIPLNARRLAQFCRLLNIRPGDISPTIVEQERQRAMAWYDAPGEAPDNVVALPKPETGGARLVKKKRQKRRRPPSRKTGGSQ